MIRTSKPLTDESGEVRELTREDFKHMVPFSALPESLKATLRKAEKIVDNIDFPNSARDTLPSK
jgi:hypothetical protein